MAKISRQLGVFLVTVLLSCFMEVTSAGRNGMSVNSFEGIPNILEISCSGEALDAGADVFAMALLHEDNTRLAQVNIMSGECTTSGFFSSCLLRKGESRKTQLRTLVMDLAPQEMRNYFCEVTYLRSGDSTKSLKWRLEVRAFATLTTGMRATPFQGTPSIQEVQCSGQVMDPDNDVLSLVLMDEDTQEILATVKPSQRQCTTSTRFSSCLIDERDPRRTVLSTLVMDLQEHSLKRFSCEVTSSRSGGRSIIFVWNLQVSGLRLEAHPFYNLPRIQEVQCSGRLLDADTSVSSIILYDITGPAQENILASFNAMQRECTTGSTFSSCLINERDNRQTRLKTLVMDLQEGETRRYGCEVTSLKSGERSRIFKWSFTVRGMRMTVGAFQGIGSVQEVQCSGAGLRSDARLVSLTLRQAYDNKFLASVNMLDSECTTSDSFSSCELNRKDDRRTNVRTLVMDLEQGEEREFECVINTLLRQDDSHKMSLTLTVRGQSLSYRVFEGISSVLQVTCTGSVLPADAEVVSISLFSFANKSRSLASVTLVLKPQCFTSDLFSSCEVDVRDSKKTALKTLVTYLKEGESAMYGCNLTSFQGRSTEPRSWSIQVKRLH